MVPLVRAATPELTRVSAANDARGPVVPMDGAARGPWVAHGSARVRAARARAGSIVRTAGEHAARDGLVPPTLTVATGVPARARVMTTAGLGVAGRVVRAGAVASVAVAGPVAVTVPVRVVPRLVAAARRRAMAADGVATAGEATALGVGVRRGAASGWHRVVSTGP